MRKAHALFYAQALRVFVRGSRQGATEGSRAPQEPIDLDRSRKVRLRETARKPVSTLDADGLTVRMTGKLCGAIATARRDEDLRVPLMIEWRGASWCGNSTEATRHALCRGVGLASPHSIDDACARIRTRSHHLPPGWLGSTVGSRSARQLGVRAPLLG